ncbi:MAG: DUF3877 family protein [Candidatus Methanomethylophilaceae archaeon]|nr:DUF3877 family protein [Candidatus Methanomethylophilaceae archaeon]
MDGEELFRAAVESVQEMVLKIGGSGGSVVLYYPFDGDFAGVEDGFREASESFHMSLEPKLGRLMVTVPAEDCERIARMPVRETLRDVVELSRSSQSVSEFRQSVLSKYPCARFGDTGDGEFDMALCFPEDQDPNVYCVSEEAGRVIFHRFSRSDYLAFGFRLP